MRGRFLEFVDEIERGAFDGANNPATRRRGREKISKHNSKSSYIVHCVQAVPWTCADLCLL
jgi:hypothetical protein